MRIIHASIKEFIRRSFVTGIVSVGLSAMPAIAQRAPNPAEPLWGKPQPKLEPRPQGNISRTAIDEKAMRVLIEQLVGCGTRLTISSWADSKRGIGCARDHVTARLNEIAQNSGRKLKLVVDKSDSISELSSGKPIHLENVYAILPGSDPILAKPYSLCPDTWIHGHRT